jgi:hypothetical protein
MSGNMKPAAMFLETGAKERFSYIVYIKTNCKSKAVPLHAMEALGGRGGAPTHS